MIIPDNPFHMCVFLLYKHTGLTWLLQKGPKITIVSCISTRALSDTLTQLHKYSGLRTFFVLMGSVVTWRRLRMPWQNENSPFNLVLFLSLLYLKSKQTRQLNMLWQEFYEFHEYSWKGVHAYTGASRVGSGLNGIIIGNVSFILDLSW